MNVMYNCTVQKTPLYLMFGRVSRLPVNLMFKNVLCVESVCDYNKHVKSLVDDLHSAMVLALKHLTVECKH